MIGFVACESLSKPYEYLYSAALRQLEQYFGLAIHTGRKHLVYASKHKGAETVKRACTQIYISILKPSQIIQQMFYGITFRIDRR